MKKYFNFAFLSAIALVGTLGFTACSSTDDTVAEESKGPGDVGAKGEVTTQFVFNVSNGSSSTTRMSGDATQASSSLAAEKFRGIDNCFIMCFNQGDDGKSLSAAATASKSFDMSRVVAEGSLSNANSRRVLEMSLPLNTNTMLFYGKAINDNTVVDYKSKYGFLDNYNVTNDLTTTYFQLGKRLTAEDKVKFQEVETLLAAVFSCIINTHRGTAAVAATDIPGEGIPAYGFALEANYMPNMLWSAYNVVDAGKNPLSPANTTPTPARPLEIKLFKVYKELTTIQEAELRNASGIALKHTTEDLWTIVNSVRCATPTNKEEALAKYMAHLIDVELRKYFTATVPTDGGAVSDLQFKKASELIDNLEADDYWPASGGTKPVEAAFSNISTYLGADFAQFPSQFALPQGATHIKFDDTKKTFYYVVNYNTSGVGSAPFTVDDYYYPAELCYFGNSPIRVSDNAHVVAEYPLSVTLWDTEATSSWPADWTLAHVQSTTRSVAMKNDINYGTALLKTTVGYTAGVLKDNNAAIQLRDYGVTEADKNITVYNNSFKLVSIIIGDQWPKVGWDFLPKTTDPGNANYRKGYIYDNQITNKGAIPASIESASEPNYTLVFDNYQSDLAVDAQSKVYVALELQNNTGRDFFGKDNLITNGSNFYLIGELDPAGKDGPSLPAYHALPPYGVTTGVGNNRTVPRVFIQDHMTTANFKIGVNSLKYAYLTVPDLRSSSVTLGLSVDLNWSTGLVFDNIVVGGTGTGN